MINRRAARNLCAAMACVFGLMDLIRGTVHTFLIKSVAMSTSGIDPHPDALVLMGAFGISNFCTGMMLLLIGCKARDLSPPVLLMLPFAYFVGGLGMQLSDVTLQSPFNGQRMMRVYLGVSLICALLYYFISYIEGQRIRNVSH